VGTIEAHGVTGLGTDNQLPAYIAGRIAEPVNALIAPAIAYGITRTLLPYPGSITVSADTLGRYVFEVGCGLADSGFRRLVFLNGHGGNTDTLRAVQARLYQERRAFTIVLDWWSLCEEDTKRVYGHAGGHAGTDETALVLHAHPEQVREEAYRPDMAWTVRKGLSATPSPGSIILYEKGEGLPDFDPARATQLADLVSARVADAILDVFRRWQALR